MADSKSQKKKGFKEFFETISPILISPTTTSLTVSLSKRFVIFQMLQKLASKIEDDPYLNFISILKSYKVLGKILHGPIKDLHRDRNKLYFKNFFLDRDLYEHVKKDIEWVYQQHQDLKVTITKRGIIVYDNYRPNHFNVLLMTIHSGIYMPKDLQKKQTLSKERRFKEEDVDTDKIYGQLVLKEGGIWIDNKFSRFACDYNRMPQRAIYSNHSEKWIDILWEEDPDESQRTKLMEGYHEFYFTLGKLIDTYRFNIIFDGHSMKDAPGRPQLSFGTKSIPAFYMPIVRSMQARLRKMGYNPVALNTPYGGGHILRWLGSKFPDVFICSMEVNKCLYMTKNRKRTLKKKLGKLSDDIVTIFDIEDTEAITHNH